MVHLILGGKIGVFYAHPFALDGYVRPFLNENNVWNHVSGTAVEILVSLSIFILFWKRRSLAILPIILLFPWSAIRTGMNVSNLASKTGDYNNIIQITGIPTAFFYGFCIIFAGIGIFFFISLLPLLGLAPEERRSLFVMPAGLLLWGLIGTVIAYLYVPGSRIDIQYHLGTSLIRSAKTYPFFGAALGAFLAIIYYTLYRSIYRRFPAGLRTEKVCFTWRNLRNPFFLFTISMVLGLIAIR